MEKYRFLKPIITYMSIWALMIGFDYTLKTRLQLKKVTAELEAIKNKEYDTYQTVKQDGQACKYLGAFGTKVEDSSEIVILHHYFCAEDGEFELRYDRPVVKRVK